MMQSRWENELETSLKKFIRQNQEFNFDNFEIKNHLNLFPDIGRIRNDVTFNQDVEDIENEIDYEPFNDYMLKNSKIWTDEQINNFIKEY
jgi:hypothetical protein